MKTRHQLAEALTLVLWFHMLLVVGLLMWAGWLVWIA